MTQSAFRCIFVALDSEILLDEEIQDTGSQSTRSDVTCVVRSFVRGGVPGGFSPGSVCLFRLISWGVWGVSPRLVQFVVVDVRVLVDVFIIHSDRRDLIALIVRPI